MAKIGVEYHTKESPGPAFCNWRGNVFFKGMGTFEVFAMNDEQDTVYVGSTDRLGDPLNRRLFCHLKPGQKITIVRPNAKLVIVNALPESK